MKIPYYQVDVFTNSVFSGNPAGVCLLDEWIDKSILQNIAAENNLSETAFLVKKGRQFEIKWFTPTVEVDLCGHATLASAFVIFNYIDKSRKKITFISNSGIIKVVHFNGILAIEFPSRIAKTCNIPISLLKGLKKKPKEVLYSIQDYLVVFRSESEIRELEPDMSEFKKLDSFGIIVTSVGDNSDFVSRFFAPNAGVDEDPATGAAHTILIPYWASRLGKTNLHAYQISKRGGELYCEDCGDKVHIAGRAVIFLIGTIEI